MAYVMMYGSRSCRFCLRAEEYLKRKGVGHITKTLVDLHPGAIETMIARTGRRSVPQIFIGDIHVGGYDDLVSLDRAGRLDQLLAT
ncbi:MAG: glutaredoxin 3 [Gammaproteobacteria bacterium]|nr:glutaredoxin 3 [Gammaproteobacteria bacterium]